MTTTGGDLDTQACVIGAGASGLAAAKALADRGMLRAKR